MPINECIGDLAPTRTQHSLKKRLRGVQWRRAG